MRIETCTRCRATLRPGDRCALLLPSPAPIAVVVICRTCLQRLAEWLGVAK